MMNDANEPKRGPGRPRKYPRPAIPDPLDDAERMPQGTPNDPVGTPEGEEPEPPMPEPTEWLRAQRNQSRTDSSGIVQNNRYWTTRS